MGIVIPEKCFCAKVAESIWFHNIVFKKKKKRSNKYNCNNKNVHIKLCTSIYHVHITYNMKPTRAISNHRHKS